VDVDAASRCWNADGSNYRRICSPERCRKTGATRSVERSPIRHQVAVVSVELSKSSHFLDLNYVEDVAATVDFNVVMNEQLGTLKFKEQQRKEALVTGN